MAGHSPILIDKPDATQAENTRLRAALLWAFDRLSVDDGMTKREQRDTMLEIGNVLTGKPSPAADYVPADWDDSAKLIAKELKCAG